MKASIWQIIVAIFMVILILGVLGLAGYGTYSLIDKYVLDKPAASETQKEAKQDKISSEQKIAYIAFEQYADID